MSLAPALQAKVNEGRIRRLDLIRFDLPTKSVGYHRGGRPYTYNGLTYLPNRWLSPGRMTGALGVAVSTRTITFSNVPTADPDDAIARIEEFDYPNAPVIISHLGGNPETDEVLGILTSSLYEVEKVRYRIGEADTSGMRPLTMMIDLQPPGRSARGATLAYRNEAEQQFDNEETDTCFEYSSVTANQPMEWGQRGG